MHNRTLPLGTEPRKKESHPKCDCHGSVLGCGWDILSVVECSPEWKTRYLDDDGCPLDFRGNPGFLFFFSPADVRWIFAIWISGFVLGNELVYEKAT